MSKFQLILLVVFGAFVVIAVLLFSVSKGSSGSNAVATVVVWGDIPTYDFNNLLNNVALNNGPVRIQYVEKSQATFSTDFTEALALGKGPDLVILPLSKIYKERNKLLLIPNTTVNPKDFSQTFVEEGELFLTPEGTYALPLSVDPLVLYWNRDLFTNASLVAPPKYWDEIYGFAEKLSMKDSADNLKQSAIALGEAKNIVNSKDILTLLMLEAGTPITSSNGVDLHSELSSNFNLPTVPAESALDFYTQFSNPAKPFYSWNRSLLDSGTAFTSGTLAMYIGFASELPLLKAKNPNLNLSITAVPQSRVSGKVITFGRLKGVAIVKNTKNQPAALNAALLLVSKDISSALSTITGLPSARRELLNTKPKGFADSVFFDSAIKSKGFVDPDDVKTGKIFTKMIESVTSGKSRITEAVREASNEIDQIISTK